MRITRSCTGAISRKESAAFRKQNCWSSCTRNSTVPAPTDYHGHSLSVSDVIALKRNGEVSVHYVDSIGFKDLQGFLDKQPERHSVLMNLKEKCDAPECNPTVCRKARDVHEL